MAPEFTDYWLERITAPEIGHPDAYWDAYWPESRQPEQGGSSS